MSAPTSETVEERIVQNVVATLQAISPTNPTTEYWTTVKRVFRQDRDPQTVVQGETPAVAMLYESSTPYYDFVGVINYDLTLQLYLCMAKASETNWARDLGRFKADVQRALRLDPRRGTHNDDANAFDSHVTEGRASNAENSPVVMARIDLLIQYRHLVNDPTVAA